MTKRDDDPIGLIEIIDKKEGTVINRHGAGCARTREVHEAFREGRMPPHPNAANAAKCGPAMVNSDAFRSGWDGIFGKKLPTGQA